MKSSKSRSNSSLCWEANKLITFRALSTSSTIKTKFSYSSKTPLQKSANSRRPSFSVEVRTICRANNSHQVIEMAWRWSKMIRRCHFRAKWQHQVREMRHQWTFHHKTMSLLWHYQCQILTLSSHTKDLNCVTLLSILLRRCPAAQSTNNNYKRSWKMKKENSRLVLVSKTTKLAHFGSQDQKLPGPHLIITWLTKLWDRIGGKSPAFRPWQATSADS